MTGQSLFYMGETDLIDFCINNATMARGLSYASARFGGRTGTPATKSVGVIG
jgi:hypothetical protein